MLRALAGACHPGPTAAVTVLGILLAIGVGQHPGTVGLFAIAVLSGQLSVGWSNDALDAGRDTASGRTDKPAAAGRVARRVLLGAAIIAAVVTLITSAALGAAGAAHLLLPAAGWAYNLGLKSTWWSGATYVVGFAGLPAAAFLAAPGHPGPPWWAPATGALLGLAAHLANVLPDLDDDDATGVRGLPHRLGARASIDLMGLLLVGAAATSVLGPAGRPTAAGSVGGAAVVAGSIAVLRRGRRDPGDANVFRAVLALALLDVTLFVLAA